MNKKTKFTPGPWEVRNGQKRIIIVQGHKFIEEGIYVAEVSREAWRPEERKDSALPDAHLIAAAPELYEALEKLLRLHDQCYCDEPELPSLDSRDRCTHCTISAALAKARGEM